jgi:hypothetical protein
LLHTDVRKRRSGLHARPSGARLTPNARYAPARKTAAFVLGAHMAYVFDGPTISSFFGIVIQMFWREHAPPHFHALYAEFEVEIDIRTLEVIKGNLPRRALASKNR